MWSGNTHSSQSNSAHTPRYPPQQFDPSNLVEQPAMSKVKFAILYIFQHERESVKNSIDNWIMAEFEI